MAPDVLDIVVGRERELAGFTGLLTDLAAGRGRCVLVEGEPGIGKSALLAAVLAATDGAGRAVSRGACDELGQRFPLSVLLETLGVDGGSREWVRAEAAAAVSGAAVSPPATRGWGVAMVAGDPVMAAAEHLLVLVDRLCAAGPLVLAVDDLQWADDATLLVWRQMCRATSQLPLLLVGTCRPVPRRPELDRLRRDIQAQHGVLIPLDRLRLADVSTLARRLAGGVPGPRLAGRLELAAGNPLYIREMLDALARAEALAVSRDVVELVDTGRPGRPHRPEDDGSVVSLSAAIADRLDFLTAGTLKVLRTAALLGPDFSVTDLSGILRRPATALAGAVEEAIAAGVLESVGPRLRFRHGLLKQALYLAIPSALRIALHRDAAQALMAAGSPVERVAELILAAMEAADGWELDWLVRNAAVLAQRAPAIAAELFEHALSHTAEDDSRYAVLEDHLAAVAFLLARYEQAEQVATRVLARTADPERRGQSIWILAYTLMRTARLANGIQLVAEACADPRASPVWRARLAALDAMILLTSGRYADAATAAAQALADGERLADPITVGYALHTSSMTRFVDHDMPGCIVLIDRALAVIGTDPQLVDLRLLLHSNQISALCNLDRFEDCAATLRTARALAERTGTPRLASYVLLASELAHQQAKWDDALAELDAFADPAYQAYLPHLPVLIHGIAALIAGHRDDQQAAARHLNALTEDLASVPYQTNNIGYLLMARAVSAERAGRPNEATATLKVLLDPGYEVLDDRSSLLPALVRLALDAGDVPTARQAAATSAAESRGRPVARAVAAGNWCRGLLESDPAPVMAAANYYRNAGRQLELGNALEDGAVLLAKGGNLEAARTALIDAVSVYADLGAAWDSRRALARLRPLGIRPGVRGARRRPQTGWEALTETEKRVAELVTAGKSNPDIAAELFLSRNTVQTHVSHILTKLGARSRVDIAREAVNQKHSAEPQSGP
jgi:DNA-binding CsgD family transcriptional regulator